MVARGAERPRDRRSAGPAAYTGPMDKKPLADLRKSYEKDELVEERAHDAPLAQFSHWMRQALDARIEEPNAMTVATVAADGRPSTRIVLIKDYDERGIVWYTNYDSRKGRELDAFMAKHEMPRISIHPTLQGSRVVSDMSADDFDQ